MPRASAPAPRKNARIDAFVLDALGFDGPRENPRRRAPRDPRPSAPYHPSAGPWAVQRALIADHRMHAAAARQQARYDVDALETAAYHDAEAERLEAELEAAGHKRPRGARYRKNPDTEAFRRWFGDSKVVDENGEPLVVYHGTDKGGFYSFDMGEADAQRPGTMFFTSDRGLARTYTRGRSDPTPPYFASVDDFLAHVKTEGDDSPWGVKTEYYVLSDEDETRYDNLDDLHEAWEDVADDEIGVVYRVFDVDGYDNGEFDSQNPKDMADLLSEVNSATTKKEGVYEVYLRIVDPYVVDAKGANWDGVPIEEEDEDGNPVTMTYTTNELARMAQDMECDGLIVRDVYDSGRYGRGGESGDVFVVFDAEQIKSAHNIGTFDPATADIRRNARQNPARRRRNARDAHEAHDEVDDWVTIEECACHSCTPMRLNPPKREATGAYADLDSIIPAIAEALAKHGLAMDGIAEVKFTRGGKSKGGACSYSRTLNQCKIMFNGLAWPAFTEESRLNTVLHEAAHAIQFLTTGRSDHGPVWQRIARSIGCTGDRCMSVEASQAMVDAYQEARGLPKRKVVTRESAMEASADFAVGDYVSFDHKRARWYGKIVSKGPMHATVMIQSPRQGITGKIPYPSLQKEAPPRFAEKVAGVDKPAPGESLSAWQTRTGREVR